MKNYFITFRSVTFAQRGEAVLRRAGVSCAMQRTPKWMEERGCGYCLRLRHQDAAQAVNILREHHVDMRRVYKQHDSGDVEEVRL